MSTLNTYLNFKGNTKDAFNFYKSVFGGDFVVLQRFKDTPFGDNLSPEDKEKIMHIALPVGNGSILMATDVLESMGQSITIGNNISISITTESEEQTDRLFNALSEGGTITMPLEKTFWNAYFGMLTDKFSIQWMLNYEYKDQK